MTEGRGGFLRDNIFLVAAVSLPLIVVLFFVAATAIPRWTVPPPQYDLVLRADGYYDQAAERLSVDYTVRDGRVEATFRALPQATFLTPARLFVFEHATMTVRTIAVDIPTDMKDGDPPRTIVVEALAGRRVTADSSAPDGYQLDNRSRRGPGLVGDLFGMNRYDLSAALIKGGRVVPIALPQPNQYSGAVYLVGWITDGAR
jgi:hypothetical protein